MAQVSDFVEKKVKKIFPRHIGGCFVEDPHVNRTNGLGLMGKSWKAAFVDFGVTRDDIPVSPITGKNKQGCGKDLFSFENGLFEDELEEVPKKKSANYRFWELFHKHKQNPNKSTVFRILAVGIEKNADKKLPNLEKVEKFFQRIPFDCFTHDDLVMGLRKTKILL